MLIAFVIGYAFYGSAQVAIYFMFFGLVLAGILNFVAYEWADKFVLWSTHTKLIKPQDNPQLYSIVQKVANEAHIPMPRVGIVDSAQPNAFATGKNPSKAVVVCTTSILRMLSPSELEAVIGHEISHVTHRDILVSSVAATLAGAISYIGQIVLFSSFFGGFGNSRGRANQNSSYFILAIIAMILIPIAAMLIQLGISRSRETSADEAGARLTQKPQELVNALRKISSTASAKQWRQNNAPSPATSPLWIVNPLSGQSIAGLFSTHPSLQKRIKAIQKVGMDLGVIVV
jgi:heat shock protein HtpX